MNEPQPAESAKHPNVTIRHARHALHLLITGACADINSHFGPLQDREQGVAYATLFRSLLEEIEEWTG